MAIDLSTVVLVIFGVLPVVFTLFLIWKLIKTGFKISVFLFIILTIIIGALGFFSYLDMQDLQEHRDLPELWLIVDGDAVLTGFEKEQAEQQEPTALTDTQLTEYRQEHEAGNVDALREGHFKVYFVDASLFDEIPPDEDLLTEDDTFALTRQRAVAIMESDQPIELYTDYFMQDKDVPEDQREQLETQVEDQLGEPNELRARMASLLLARLLNEHGTEYFLEKVKSGEVEVYPHGITETIISYLPTSMTSKLMGGH